jgi:hypothetical protein
MVIGLTILNNQEEAKIANEKEVNKTGINGIIAGLILEMDLAIILIANENAIKIIDIPNAVKN